MTDAEVDGVSGEQEEQKEEEGCLSIPGLYVEIVRPKTIHLKGFDIHGNDSEPSATVVGVPNVQVVPVNVVAVGGATCGKPVGFLPADDGCGTTYSAVATVEDGKPKIIPNRTGGRLTPSVIELVTA